MLISMSIYSLRNLTEICLALWPAYVVKVHARWALMVWWVFVCLLGLKMFEDVGARWDELLAQFVD